MGVDDGFVYAKPHNAGEVHELGPELAAVYLREGWAELADVVKPPVKRSVTPKKKTVSKAPAKRKA